MSTAAQSPMFFILGRGRSGTTLLSRMLGMHDNIVVAPEGFFAMNLWRRYGRKPFTEAQVDDFCRDLLRENRMQTWNLDTTDVAIRLRSALSAMHGAVSYSRACELVYESYAHVTLGKVSARLFGDKNPHYALLVERLLKTFPHARFLHMVRDPRDNILSYKSVPFDVNDSRALAYRWRAYNLRLLRAQAAAPDRFLQVRFEDLLANADAELGRVCEFLGIAYEPSMLSFFEESPVDFYGQGSAWFGNLDRPIDPSQTNKWQSQLGADDVSSIENICGDLLEEFGYASSSMTGLDSRIRAAPGVAVGALSVLAEDLIFAALPAEWRVWLINRYRKHSGRI